MKDTLHAPDKDGKVDEKPEDRDPAWFAKLNPAERPKAQDVLHEIDRVLARMLKDVKPSTPRSQ